MSQYIDTVASLQSVHHPATGIRTTKHLERMSKRRARLPGGLIRAAVIVGFPNLPWKRCGSDDPCSVKMLQSPFVGLNILFRPFRALVIVALLFPRALPWAVVFAPLQGEKHAA